MADNQIPQRRGDTPPSLAVQVAAARARVALDRDSRTSTPQWILNVAATPTPPTPPPSSDRPPSLRVQCAAARVRVQLDRKSHRQTPAAIRALAALPDDE